MKAFNLNSANGKFAKFRFYLLMDFYKYFDLKSLITHAMRVYMRLQHNDVIQTDQGRNWQNQKITLKFRPWLPWSLSLASIPTHRPFPNSKYHLKFTEGEGDKAEGLFSDSIFLLFVLYFLYTKYFCVSNVTRFSQLQQTRFSQLQQHWFSSTCYKLLSFGMIPKLHKRPFIIIKTLP